MTTLIIATRNAHKVEEIRGILGAEFQFLTLRDFPNAPAVVEDANTFAGNSTKKAVELLDEIHQVVNGVDAVPMDLLRKNIELTDANAVVFDAANKFAGCIPGIHEVLRRQGLLENILCLNPHEVLSPGQAQELTRIQKSYPWMQDDEFVREHLDEWLAG